MPRACSSTPRPVFCTDHHPCNPAPQLWPSLDNSAAYPIPPGTALVSKNLQIVRQPGTYALCQSIGSLSVITAAMPCGIADRRPKGGWAGSPWAAEIGHRIRSVLHAAAALGHQNLVLGAFGCGAFGNPAGAVAAVFRKQLSSPEFRGAFGTVVREETTRWGSLGQGLL